MAEALFRDFTHDRDDVRVLSAGLAASRGQLPSALAVETLIDEGIDLSDFRSQPLTENLVDKADWIVVMTRGHMDTVKMLFPQAMQKTWLLRDFDADANGQDQDLADPIGQSRAIYDHCRDVMKRIVPNILKFMDGKFVPRSKQNRTKGKSDRPTVSSSLAAVDPKIFAAIEAEAERQDLNIELIASENFTSKAVREAQGSILTNKYAEGYPGKRWYGGCENVDVVEQLAIDRAKQLFQAEHVNVQPHSGAQANMAVYFSVLEPGDKILTMNLSHGGHLTHGHKTNFSGRFYEVHQYGVNEQNECIDYEALAKQAEIVQPKMITVGASAYSRIIDFERMYHIAQSVGAYLFADMAHISGLVAGGVHPSPMPFADFVTTTTHKSLRGPRGGMILCKEKYGKAIDSQVFPGVQGGPLMHVIAGKAVCLHEALQPEFKDYQKQIVYNAKSLAAKLTKNGYRLVSGGTDNHLMLVDLRPLNVTGKEAQEILDKAGITVNKNALPFDTISPFKGGGIRVGTPAVTTRGMKEEEMMEIADLIHEALMAREDERAIAKIRDKVHALTQQYPLP